VRGRGGQQQCDEGRDAEEQPRPRPSNAAAVSIPSGGESDEESDHSGGESGGESDEESIPSGGESGGESDDETLRIISSHDKEPLDSPSASSATQPAAPSLLRWRFRSGVPSGTLQLDAWRSAPSIVKTPFVVPGTLQWLAALTAFLAPIQHTLSAEHSREHDRWIRIPVKSVRSSDRVLKSHWFENPDGGHAFWHGPLPQVARATLSLGRLFAADLTAGSNAQADGIVYVMKSLGATGAYQVPFYIGSPQLTKLVFEVRGAADARYFPKRGKAKHKQFAFYAKHTRIFAVWCQPLDADKLVGEYILPEMLPEHELALQG